MPAMNVTDGVDRNVAGIQFQPLTDRRRHVEPLIAGIEASLRFALVQSSDNKIQSLVHS